MEYNIKQEAVRIINEHILTPVIYMFENDAQAEFVCFCDMNIDPAEFVRVEERLAELIDKEIILMDIREYDDVDRMEIVSDAELVYSAHPMFGHIFERSMIEDARARQIEKNELIRRYNASGSMYLQ